MTGRGNSGMVLAKRSRSYRAGLNFPVSRVHRLLRKGKYAERVGNGAAVYLAAVLEYMVAEVLDVAAIVASDNKKRRIIPRHLLLGIRNDEDLNKLTAGVHIVGGGVVPYIDPALLKSTRVPNTKTNAENSRRKEAETRTG